MTLAEQRVAEEYREQGFQRVVVRHDEPNFAYPVHYHAYTLVLQVMEGELTVTMNHHETHLSAGQHAVIPAQALHRVTIGQNGCTYIHAEKRGQE